MAHTTEQTVRHTPGPWTLYPPSVIGHADVLFGPARGDNHGCATILSAVGHYEEADANARLIAAAPELFAALKALLGDIESGLLVRDIARDGDSAWALHMIDFVGRLQAAQTAILKVEGR